MKKKVLSMLITFAMLFSMLPATALAVEGEGTIINLSGGSCTIETAGEYAVSAYNGANTLTVKANATITLADVNITAAADTSAISIESGSVTLIVDDDSTLIGGDNGAGIYVAEDASVTIQSKNNAKLTAIGNAGEDDNSGAAGIGGTKDNGNSGAITIDGATVLAKGHGRHGAGIGSGNNGEVKGEIKIINSADVTAYGGYCNFEGEGPQKEGASTDDMWAKKDYEGGAAIGGGSGTGSTIANITITGSAVVAFGGPKSAGIGAGYWSNCDNITITNSEIEAYGGSSSAGIGTSRVNKASDKVYGSGNEGTIVIYDSTVEAVGGDFGAGIGTGYNADSCTENMAKISVKIKSGEVNATGGMAAAGIGGGYKNGSAQVEITGGEVTAKAGAPLSEELIYPGQEEYTTWYDRTACAIGSGAHGDHGVNPFKTEKATVTVYSAAEVSVTAYEDGKPAIEGVANDTLEDAYTEIKAPRTGTVTPAYTKEVDGYVRVWGEGGGNAKENLELKLYADETLIATTKLNNVEGVIDGDVYVTWNFYYPNYNDSYWTTTWEEGHPNSVAQPTKVELYIDDVKVAENAAKMSAPDDRNPVVWRELGGVEQTDLVETDGVYTIKNLKELQIFRNTVNAGNTYQGKTVKLAANIDLNGEEWTPIGTSKNPFNGTFDGQNHTISNLVIIGSSSDVGLFGLTKDGEVKNLTVNNAKVSGYLNVGVVAGTPYTSKYTNISVTGHVEVNGFAYVGGVGGKNAYANWTNITVNADDDSYVKATSTDNDTAYRTYVGGVVGFMGEGNHGFENVTSNIDVTGSTCDVGGIVGIAHYGNFFKKVTCSGDVTTLADNVEDACESGGIAGVWHNGGSPVTFEELTYTGSLSAPNVEEEFTFPNSGLIGAPYSSTGTGTIDGDIAAVGGKTYATLAAAINVARADDTVYLLGDATESAQFIIGAQQTITLDLGGNELTCSGFLNYGTLNIKNGALVGNDSSYSTIESTGTLTLTDVDVTGARHAVRIEGGTSIIDGGDYKLSGTSGMTTHAINVSDGGEVTIKGGTFTGPKGTDADSGAAVNVQADSTVNIEGGSFSGGKNETLASKGALSLTGGTYDQNPSAYVAEGYVAAFDESTSTYFVYAPAIQVTYPVGNPVYPEGKVEYYNDMLEAVPYTTNCPRLEGATVTLLTDIEAPGIRMMENDMVLDLNRHTYTITAGTGSQGTNTSGFQIRPEVTTKATIKNGTIKVAEGAPVVWMFNNYASNFVVEDVVVDCANMAYGYGENCYVHISHSDNNTTFTGTTKIVNFDAQKAGNAINVGGTMIIKDTATPGGTIELNADATLTARKGLTVTTDVANKVVKYESGVYSLVTGYTVTFDVNGGSAVDAQKVVSGAQATQPDDPTRSGYTFQGWYSDSGLTTAFDFIAAINADTTIYAKWSRNSSGGGGGSYTPSYTITVDDAKNGDITVSPKSASSGTTVTITVDPDKGYVLETLTVLDKNGKEIELTKKADNKYTFKMPASKVTVEASFAKTSSSPVDSFLDVNTGAWYYDAVKYAVENGLMSGTGTYTFEPNTTLSRGMIAQMLYALEGKPSVSSANNFTDVSSSDWYDKAASWAQSKGIITGYEDGRFGPNDPLTREQLALILYNYAKSEGHSTSTKADLSKFADDTSTSPWAQQAMSWAVGEGLLSGRGVNMLYPTGTATRAEVAQIMMNFCENVAK